MAFQKSGNALLGPLILLLMASLTEFVFRIHVGSARLLAPVSTSETRVGRESFESVAAAALGPKIHGFSMILVTAMCFFGTVGYAVLLRDMLQPVTDAIWHVTTDKSVSGPTLHNNLSMAAVALLTTPLCTLKTLTSLQRFGAASMFSVLILGACVVYRSVECNLGWLPSSSSPDASGDNAVPASVWPAFHLLPNSWKDVLDAFPLFVSCYVCHYNLVPVHNELQEPSKARVVWWLKSTTWVATLFYMMIGVAGSAYGHCTPTGQVHGNVLLDFRGDDPLLLVGRMCLALTITLAFPMLTIPARDILLRSFFLTKPPSEQDDDDDDDDNDENGDEAVDVYRVESMGSTDEEGGSAVVGAGDNLDSDNDHAAALRAPLLPNGHDVGGLENAPGWDTASHRSAPGDSPSFVARLWAAIFVFWSAIVVASCVESIDVVWDLLGSSLSILLSFLIPCGSYLVIARKVGGTTIAEEVNGHDGEHEGDDHNEDKPSGVSKCVAWVLVLISVPLMVISTANAVHKIFFDEKPKSW